MFTRMLNALKSRHARADERRAYHRLIESDDLPRDIGVAREEIRRAMLRR